MTACSDYKLRELLGTGSSGKVYRSELEDGTPAAVKVVPLHRYTSRERLQVELKLLASLTHPACVRHVCSDEHEGNIFMVMEYANCGDLLSVLRQRSTPFPSPVAAELVSQLLSAVVYLHEKMGVAHRDIKPENVLIHRTATPVNGGEASLQVKLADFECVTPLRGSEKLCDWTVPCGTWMYMPPEVLLRDADLTPADLAAVDVYDVGITAFVALFRSRPFLAPNRTVLLQMIGRGVQFPQQALADVPPEARHFCSSLLNPDRRLRPTARQALLHLWLLQRSVNEDNHDPILSPTPDTPAVVSSDEGEVLSDRDSSAERLGGSLTSSPKRIGHTLSALIVAHGAKNAARTETAPLMVPPQIVADAKKELWSASSLSLETPTTHRALAQ
eukprot:TRINITY_DN6408_c0_g1_i1.p1 TRINITY_DN6408_c0_g1~~TRINITY_DN6408_c0_g1_i1.p1  ORF type:complete len:388 (+),score=51.11 TRINITY_DN6408_c0_g1_i1:40-1203(+)